MAKKKIAILGGGAASLTTAFWLTNQNNWQDNYEITIYQLGWRLGGKLWNGRVQHVGDRDDEHGYHILFGFYNNAFNTFKQMYDELGRDPNQPISRLYAERKDEEEKFPHRFAFHRMPIMYMAAHYNDTYKTIEMKFPENNLLPGTGEEVSFLATIENLLGWLLRFASQANDKDVIGDVSNDPTDSDDPLWREIRKIATDLQIVIDGGLHNLVELALAIHKAFHGTMLEDVFSKLIVFLISEFLRQTWDQVKDKVETDWDSYFYWILLDIAGTSLIGLIEDDIWDNGYDSLNNINFYDWLLKHGKLVTPEGTRVMVSSVMVEFAYLLLFAYRGGDTSSPPTDKKPVYGDPNIETGTLLRFALRLLLNYKGAFGWEFQVNAGDALVAPMYEVLSRRGVKFNFFHKVTQLRLSADKTSVQFIDMEEQVKLTVGEYQPLITVKDVPTWPHKPLYEQIDPSQAAELIAQDVDLESKWTAWTGTPKTLEAGVHFDEIVLGISIGALNEICSEMRDDTNNPKWKLMLDHLETVRSFAIQTWLNKDLKELGWNQGQVLSNSGFSPVDLRADTTQVIQYENFPSSANVKNRSYFGGLMPNDPNEPAGPDPSYPPSQNAIVKQWAIEFLNDGSQVYWPNAVNDGEFDWSLLVDIQEPSRVGVERFNSQFWVANIDPTGRYVQAVVNSSQYRLAANESGYSNLYLTGDWTKTGLNCGSMEATVMSGMNASRAISGFPAAISGETDFVDAQAASRSLSQIAQGLAANPLVRGFALLIVIVTVVGLLWGVFGQGN